MMIEDKQIKDNLLAELQKRSEQIEEMGGRESVDRQKKRGKLTASSQESCILEVII